MIVKHTDDQSIYNQKLDKEELQKNKVNFPLLENARVRLKKTKTKLKHPKSGKGL